MEMRMIKVRTPDHPGRSESVYRLCCTGAHTGGGGYRAANPLQTHQNRNLKNTDFVDIISKLLRDLPFSRNQPLKSADDCTLEF
jgi:hypothetical protein